MSETRTNIPTGIHDRIASEALPKGAHLKCANPSCGRGERITSADAARYLAHGWPMHCGQTMELVPEHPR